eukprot:9273557-Pyramimonas_sp.AAC.1
MNSPLPETISPPPRANSPARTSHVPGENRPMVTRPSQTFGQLLAYIVHSFPPPPPLLVPKPRKGVRRGSEGGPKGVRRGSEG